LKVQSRLGVFVGVALLHGHALIVPSSAIAAKSNPWSIFTPSRLY